jgi:hypothetical protein
MHQVLQPAPFFRNQIQKRALRLVRREHHVDQSGLPVLMAMIMVQRHRGFHALGDSVAQIWGEKRVVVVELAKPTAEPLEEDFGSRVKDVFRAGDDGIVRSDGRVSQSVARPACVMEVGSICARDQQR